MTAVVSSLPAPRRVRVRSRSGLWEMERALRRSGFEVVAGVDEAGRGACAGPLVVASVSLPPFPRGVPSDLAELGDSKALTQQTRQTLHGVVTRRALDVRVVVVSARDVDHEGVHVADLRAMRRAVAALQPAPDFVLTDGFPVPGLAAPGLGVWKGDSVAACVAAASIVAKHTRDELMMGLDRRFPGWGFAQHKGYVTSGHRAALSDLGPSPEHRRSFVTVRRVLPTEKGVRGEDRTGSPVVGGVAVPG